VATYTDADWTSLTEAKVYSDVALTALVEDITANMVNVGTGLYEASVPLTYGLYMLGTVYYLKLTYTPPSAASRTQVFRFLLAPAGQQAGAGLFMVTDQDALNVQDPALGLRVGSGAFRDADLCNAVYGQRSRFEVNFPTPGTRRGKLLYLIVFNTRADEPWKLAGLNINLDGGGLSRGDQ
jgi:hypothetical protein